MNMVMVGIDSGGTRTNVLVNVVNSDGGVARTSSYEVGESLSGALAPKLVSSVMHRVFAPLDNCLTQLGDLGVPAFAWISAAGYSPSIRDTYIQALEELGPTLQSIGVRAVGVANDAVTLLLGSAADGIVIAGTGSSSLVKSADGALYQSGGRDWVASDYGSGFWIGLRAIRQAYRDFEAGEDSVLLNRLRGVYGIRPDDERALIAKMRDMSVGDENMKKEIARLAASVCAAAERGDVGSQNIVKTEAEDLADVMAGSLRRRFTRDDLADGLTIVRCGSVIGNAFFASAFQSQVERRLLSGSDRPAAIHWTDAATGREAAVALAGRIQRESDALLRLSLDFRPAVVHF